MDTGQLKFLASFNYCVIGQQAGKGGKPQKQTSYMTTYKTNDKSVWDGKGSLTGRCGAMPLTFGQSMGGVDNRSSRHTERRDKVMIHIFVQNWKSMIRSASCPFLPPSHHL